MPADRFESYLPDMALLIGQSDMPKPRLDRARKLRAIINVETNFLQNVDYDACFEGGIHVLAPGSAFAKPVAEMALGMAIDLCRGVTTADRAMRQGQEKWLLDGAEGCFSLYGARVGLIGFGDLARAFTPLLAPFNCPIKAYDPWVSDHFMAGFGVAAASLEEVLKTSQIIVVFASVTSENQGFLGQARIRQDYAWLCVPVDEPRGRGRFPRVSAAGRERSVSRGDRRLSHRARAARRTGAKGGGPAAVAASGRRNDGRTLRDRPADGGGRRSRSARTTAAFLPARPARDGRALPVQTD